MNKQLKLKYRYAASLLILTAFRAFASDISVPDIETRIRNTGNAVPEGALPSLPSPFPAAVPEYPPVPLLQEPPAAEAEPLPAEPVSRELPVPDVPEAPRPVMGYALLGAGYPGLLKGELFVHGSKARSVSSGSPEASLHFAYDAADAYTGSSVGEAFFDRSIDLRASVRHTPGIQTGVWSLDASLSSGSDGFQGKNDRYWSLSSREIAWNGAYSSRTESAPGAYWGASFAGLSRLASPDSLAGAIEPYVNETIIDAASYQIIPGISAGWAGSAFGGTADISLSGGYFFEGMADIGEFHQGSGDLSLLWERSFFRASLSGGLRYDSEDGVLAPFAAALDFDHPLEALSLIHVSAGLSADRASPWDLASDHPFVERNRLSALSSDWFAQAQASVTPAERVSFSTALAWKKTAFGRGVLAVTDTLDQSSLLETARVERDSLESSLALAWTPSVFTLEAAWNAQWLDLLWKDGAHEARFSVGVKSPGPRPLWDARAQALVALDYEALPEIGVTATLRPADMLSFIVSVEDGLSPMLGETRYRLGNYALRSGSFSASARVDF